MSKTRAADSINFLITDIARTVRAVWEKQISEMGLAITPGEVRTLIRAQRCGVVRQLVLAENLGVEPMTMSVYLDKLEGYGYVRRIPDPKDKRAKLVELTDAAQDVLKEVEAISLEIRSRISTVLPPAKLEEMRTGLEQMLQVLTEMRTEDSDVHSEF